MTVPRIVVPGAASDSSQIITIKDLRAHLAKYGRVNPVVDAHLIALRTIGSILGGEWCGKWAAEFSSENVKAGMYFRPKDGTDEEHIVWRHIRLAELLFNLQSVAGFEQRREEWRGHKPEAIVAELESAYYMKACGHFPTFLPVSRDGKRSHDFYVTLSFGLQCAWEAKSKLEQSSFGEDALIGSLQDARKQLPKDANNIIFIRIPEEWTIVPDFQSRIEAAVNHLFRNSRRVITVLLHWELWLTHRNEPNNFGISGTEFPNLRWSIISGSRRVMEGYRGFPSGWVHFCRV